jgi:uncharacterized protein
MAARLDKITTNPNSRSKVTSSDFLTNFNRHPETDQLVRLTNSEAIKRSIRNLIMTERGERLFQPDIGSNISRILFEPMVPQTAIVLEQYILEVINNFEPRAGNVQVFIQANDFNNSYEVSIAFTVINNSDPVVLNLSLSRVR